MIISYLARIVLLLPDLSASDNDRLLSIAQSSYTRKNANRVDFNLRVNSTSDLLHNNYVSSSPTQSHRLNLQMDRSQSWAPLGKMHKQFSDNTCISVNDTQRKHLLQLHAQQHFLTRQILKDTIVSMQ
ncbi:hypothetical protein RB195_023986 [Necator americanus]|uniref:Uncharacterized protein n=1 Tax=Necator americanus TaxID=51031 RepID=A0ABR1ELC9_NECAM